MARPSGGPTAIVLGLNPNGLGIVKSLQPWGVPVLAIDRPPAGWGDTHRWMSSRTRLCEKVFLPPEAPLGTLLEKLLEIGPSFEEKPVIFPSGDQELLLLAENREELCQFFRFHAPPPKTLDLFVRKVGFEEYCAAQGVPVPGSVWHVSGDTAPGVMETLRLPCIVKPAFRDQRWDRLYSPRKGFQVDDSQGLAEAVAEAEKAGVPLVVQEVIPGADSLLHFSHVYLDGGSKLIQGWTGRKLRQLPIHFGTSTLAETTDDPEVMELTLRLLRPVSYHGYASVEFKRDLRDGTLRVMEVTVGRTWYPHLLGVAAGVNLPLAWYRDLTDHPQEPRAEPRIPVRWVDEYRDVLATVDYWMAGELGVVDWVASFGKVRACALFSFRDPAPGFFVLIRLAISAWNTLCRAIRRVVPGRTDDGAR